jgi:hypothetical protein
VVCASNEIERHLSSIAYQHLLDWDSVPAQVSGEPLPPPDPKQWDGGLSCPFCRKKVSSTPGRTLHIKQLHPDHLQEYLDLLKQKLAAAEIRADDEDDVVSRTQENDQLRCPFCGQKSTSTPGRTLHVKAKHPERLEEYKNLSDKKK